MSNKCLTFTTLSFREHNVIATVFKCDFNGLQAPGAGGKIKYNVPFKDVCLVSNTGYILIRLTCGKRFRLYCVEEGLDKRCYKGTVNCYRVLVLGLL